MYTLHYIQYCYKPSKYLAQSEGATHEGTLQHKVGYHYSKSFIEIK